jgi:hypothetical protein
MSLLMAKYSSDGSLTGLALKVTGKRNNASHNLAIFLLATGPTPSENGCRKGRIALRAALLPRLVIRDRPTTLDSSAPLFVE